MWGVAMWGLVYNTIFPTPKDRTALLAAMWLARNIYSSMRGYQLRTWGHSPCLANGIWVAQRMLHPSRSLCRLLKFVMPSSLSSTCCEPDTFQKASGPSAQVPAIIRNVGRATEAHSQPLKCAIRGILVAINYRDEDFISYLSKTDRYTTFFPDYFVFTIFILGTDERTMSTLWVRFLRPERQ